MPQIFREFTFTWITKNFFLYGEQSNLTSEYFVAENIDQSLWRISICFKDYSSEYILLEIGRCEEENEEKELTLDLEMELCISENQVLCVTDRKRGVTFGGRMRRACVFSNVLSIEEFNKKMKAASSDTLIVRCRMFATAETNEGPPNLSSTDETALCLDELSYIRCVEYSDSPDWTSRLRFPINETQQLDVNIKNHDEDILFDFILCEKMIFRIIRCEITLLDYEGKEKHSNRVKFALSAETRVDLFPPFLKRTMFKQKKCFLRLKFKFTFPNGTTIREYVGETEQLSLSCSSKVCKNTPATNSVTDDLRKMLFSEEHADVSFRVEGEMIRAHKVILASRSPVFSAKFNHQMTEKETGVVHIQDMDVHTLKLFLEFVYTGQLKDLDHNRMLELLLAADKYQVQSLKENCSRFLKQHISQDNVCDVVSVANMVGEQTLKVAAMDYIKDNIAAVINSSRWSMLTDQNVKLCSEIICNFSESLKGILKKT